MGIIDIIILILFAGAAVLGYRRGLIAQAASIGGVVAGLVACRMAGDWATGVASTLLGADGEASAARSYAASLLGNGTLFCAVWCGVWVFSRILRKAARALMFGPIDGVGGSLFLILKWGLVMSLLLNLWKVIAPDSPIFISSTLLHGEAFRAIMDLAPWLMGAVAPNLT